MTNLPAAISTALLRAEIDAVLADWAWHLDHGDYDALAELFTEQALFVTGAVELRGRPAIKNRYTERLVVRSTRHTYSGLRVYPVAADSSAAADGRPAQVSARSTWVTYSGRYKGSDGFGPVGPWIATADEIPDPHALTVTCVHQGRVITEDSTQNLMHKVADVVSYMSGYQTLEPGDIIAMGTALKASASGGTAVQNVNLTELGGPIEVTISGIGTLSNPVEMR